MDPEKIELDRGDKGLGFNIKGGTDQQHVPSDDGIFVTKIREDGAAAVDGRLKKGDRILEINDTDVRRVPHKQAVDLFLSAGNEVVLVVVHGAEQEALEAVTEVEKNNPNSTAPTDGDSKSGNGTIILLGVTVVAAALAVGLFWYLRVK